MQIWNKHQNIINKNILNGRNESQVPNRKKYFDGHILYVFIDKVMSIEILANVHMNA